MRLDPQWFRPESIPEPVRSFNHWLEADLAPRLSIIDVGPERARQARDEGLSVFGPLLADDNAYDEEIEGPAGSLRLHIIEPSGIPSGVYMHVHGGGWVLGAAHQHDGINSRLVDQANVVSVSVEYRLAPEHPHPAALEDCIAAARWLIGNCEPRWGTDLLVIGGESAGAHLAVLTMLASDRGAFSAAQLSYGVYDVGSTPSARNWGERNLILNTPLIDWFADQAHPGSDRTDPSVSPLYADLAGLPPARFSVGTLDPLLDDSLFMASRWAASGNQTELAVYIGAVHAFDYFPQHPYTDEAISAAASWLRG